MHSIRPRSALSLLATPCLVTPVWLTGLEIRIRAVPRHILMLTNEASPVNSSRKGAQAHPWQHR